MKRRIPALVLALAFFAVFCACGSASADADRSGADGPGGSAPEELIVFAAASMTETLEQIAVLYKEVAPNITLVFNFDSSGTLKTQIREGADCDVFISAAPGQMDQLDISKDGTDNPERLDFIIPETRIDLLENKVVLVVPAGNPSGIDSFDTLMARLETGDVLLAVGNRDVPVGQYTLKLLNFYGLSESEAAEKGCLNYGSNVKEVTTHVSESVVDCGIVYATDAGSAGLKVVDTATAAMCGQVIYPAAVLNVSRNQKEAEAFLQYLQSPDAAAVFEAAGFTPVY